MRAVPWQVRGIDPEAREAALVAAHSVGMSLGEWLSSVIHDKAAEQGVGQDDDTHAQGDEGLAAINERLDDLSRQLGRLQGHAPPPRPVSDPASSRIADAILQLNGRLDLVIAENRNASSALEKRVSSVDRALANLSQERVRVGYAGSEPASPAKTIPRGGPPGIPPSIPPSIPPAIPSVIPRSAPGNAGASIEDAVAEIAARQRALDGEFAAPPSAALQRPPFAPIQCRADEAFDGLRKDLAEIGRTISEAMPRRPDEDFAGLRRDLAEISRSITQAMPRRPDDEVAGLRKDLAEISRTISEAAPRRTDEAVAGLRKDLAEISRTLAEAMPRRAIEALEGEVRALVGKLDASPRAGADAPGLAGLEQGLREVRDALHGLAPAESLVGFDAAVRTLSAKIDQVAAGGHDPAGLQQLEAAIASLHGVMDHVASGDALAALAQDVHALADRLEYRAPVEVGAAGADFITTLDARIGTIADAIEAVREQSLHAAQVVQAAQEAQSVQAAQVVQVAQAAQAQAVQASQSVQDPHGAARELDQLVRSLNDKLEHLQTARVDQLSRGEQLAIGGLEDRIAKLVEKLDASEGRLGHLEAIERGMAELLVHLESLRANGASAALRPAFAEPSPAAAPAVLSQDVAALRQAQVNVERRTEDSLEVVHGAIETVVDRLATIESNIRGDQPDASVPAPPRGPASPPVPPPMPAPAARPAVAAAPPPPPAPARAAPAARAATAARAPGDDHLPHDYPLEPGSGPPRVRPGSPGIAALANAAERVAASEASLRAVRAAPAPSEADAKSGYLQAARRAAQYAAQNAQRGDAAAPGDPDKAGGKLGQRLKAIFVGISVAVIIVVALRFAASYLQSADLGPTSGAPAVAQRQGPLIVAGPDPRPAATPDAPLVIAPPLDQPLPPANSARSADTTANLPPLQAPSGGMFGADQPMAFPPLPPAAPSTANVPVARTDSRDVTGSINTQTPQAAPATPATPAAPAPAPAAAPAPPVAPAEMLPAGIGGKTLIAAAMAGEPAAAYEIATRFAEGRGVPSDYRQAAVWYTRAANAGLAPAMFRLGALYEKGNGVTKDLNQARRLYVAAAEKGNANAMHNVGVLYAEGLDGKPDFKTAADWFRKSAMMGIADSQYNLAVLYARGIGVGQNLGEAYQWFALAARSGDADAAKKRDDLGARLDSNMLAELRQKVDGWVAHQAPQEASVVPVPPGGWDKAESAPTPAPKAKPTKHTRARANTTPI